MEKTQKTIFLIEPIPNLFKYKDLRCIKNTYIISIAILTGITVGRNLPI
jgi:hypothetical protein